MSKLNRKQPRLKKYDYSKPGYYFVTSCTHNMQNLFGNVIDGEMVLNNAGRMIEEILKETPAEFNDIELNKYIIMPNHIHAIIVINPRSKIVGADSISAQKSMGSNKADIESAPTLSNVVQSFKRHTTIEYIKGVKSGIYPPFNKKIWQRSFHDHIIRNHKEYQRIWLYIDTNPQKWELDKYYSQPEAKK